MVLANWFEDRSSLETSLVQEMAQDELMKLRRYTAAISRGERSLREIFRTRF